jgi:hypothetical protein
VTEWALDRIVWFDWAAPTTYTREDWVAQDGGYFVNPPAGTDLEPVYVSPADLAAGRTAGLTLLSALVGAVPWLGEVKDAIQLFTGKDLITGERLSWFDRLIGLLGPLSLGLDAAHRGAAATVATLDNVYGEYRKLALEGKSEEALAVLKSVVLAEYIGGAASVAQLAGGLDAGMDALGVVDGVQGLSLTEATTLAQASEALRGGADPDSLEWTAETGALLHVGVLEADGLTRTIDERRPLPPGNADEVRGLLARGFVRQAQADGLLPARLEVTPAAAEGGDPTETIDVWDPKTGTAWDLDGGGAEERVGGTMTSSTGQTVTITRVVTVPLPPL